MYEPNAFLPEEPPRLLYPVRDACQQLGGMSRTTLYEKFKTGEIQPIKIGSRTFIARDELERYVVSLQRPREAVAS